jgi:hypothetical protein
MHKQSKPKKVAKKAARDVPAAVRRATGKVFERDLKAVGDKTLKYTLAAKGEGSEEDITTAWSEFSAMVARAVSKGRLWTPERVAALSLVLLSVDAEIRELERVSKAFDVAGDSKRLAKLITSPVVNVPPLPLIDRLAVALQTTKGEARRAAGYLDETAQPPEEGGANE